MKIVFTDHAIKRCKQQKVSLHEIITSLKDVPSFTGRISWVVSGGHEVVMKRDNHTIVIITVISFKKKVNKQGGFGLKKAFWKKKAKLKLSKR
jgi:hypothetical protein